ncbi:MAG: hypothetical protein MJ236_00875 [Clostridia bacterium]|nr:hypothetical protein [Clostridia bacterium]
MDIILSSILMYSDTILAMAFGVEAVLALIAVFRTQIKISALIFSGIPFTIAYAINVISFIYEDNGSVMLSIASNILRVIAVFMLGIFLYKRNRFNNNSVE